MTIIEILQYYNSPKNIQHELGISSATDVDWCSFSREVCKMSIIKSSKKTGVSGVVVEIDKSKFAKR